MLLLSEQVYEHLHCEYRTVLAYNFNNSDFKYLYVYRLSKEEISYYTLAGECVVHDCEYATTLKQQYKEHKSHK